MKQSATTLGLALLGGVAFLATSTAAMLADEKPWYPFKVQVWDPPFDMASPRKDLEYNPLEKADKKWDICVSFPHMKDAYWMAVDYGVVAEAARLGVKMQLVEAGGYTNLNKQISQIEDCVSAGSQGVVIGAISYEGLNNLASESEEQEDPGDRRHQRDVIAGHLRQIAGVVRRETGAKTGEYLAKLHPAGSGKGQGRMVPRSAGRRMGRGREQRLHRRGEGKATSWSSTPSTATRARRFSSKLVEDVLTGQSRHLLHRRNIAYGGSRRSDCSRPRRRRQDQGAGVLLHAAGLSRHQGRNHSGRAHGLGGDPGAYCDRPGGPHPRGQRRCANMWDRRSM